MRTSERPGAVSVMKLAARLLWRDWRAGELRVLAAALVVAVASMTTVSFFSDRVSRTIAREANQLLGADLVVVSRQAIAPVFAERAGELGLAVTTAVRFPSMAQHDGRTLLTEVKAVGEGFPLRGRLRIRVDKNGPDFEPKKIPEPGTVWIDERLMRRLDVAIGDTLTLGDRDFKVAALVIEEPESSVGFMNLGPRLMFNQLDLDSTGRVAVGSRVSYRVFVAGTEAAIDAYREFANARIRPGEKVEDIRDARPEINSALERANNFLGLSALLTVILAGVAIALAARRHLQRHLDACAIMRCLGTTQREILLLHVLQFAIAGLIASALGCAIGFAAQQLLTSFLAPLVQVALPPAGWRPVVQGFAAGFVLLLGFALPPLIALKQVPTLRVLRRDLGMPDTAGFSAYALGAVAMAVLVLWQAQDLKLGAYVLAGVVVLVVVSATVTVAAIGLLSRLVAGAGFSWRFGLANLRRRTVGSVIQVVALALGLMALILLTLVRNDLLASWQNSLPPDAPNRFLVNIQTEQKQSILDFFAANEIARPTLHPMVRGRLTAINGKPVSSRDFVDERAKRLVDREFNLSWAAQMQPDNVIVAGHWFSANDRAKPVVSVEEGIAEALELKLGDRLSYDVAGVPLEVEITSLRKVDWDSFRVNFFVLAPPGVLEGYPASWVTSFHLARENGSLMDALIRDFPNLLVIDVASILDQVKRMIDQVVRAVEFVFLFSIIAALLVLLAAVSTTHDERRFDAAVMRTLGAMSSQLRAVQAAEFAFIGALAGLLASLGASATGWALAHQVLNVPYTITPSVWIVGVAAGAIIVTIAGLAGTAGVLRTPPMQVFRA